MGRKVSPPDLPYFSNSEKRSKPIPGLEDPRDAAAYVADMLIELRNVADTANLTFLAFLLDIAFEEAIANASRYPPSDE
jgi:hypothetical protein